MPEFFLKHFPSIPSTHREGKENLANYKKFPTLITCDEQTEGIGRRGTKWTHSKGKTIAATFIFSADGFSHPENTAQILAYTALSLLEHLHFLPLFKWPNDILLSQKKVGGVLSEIVDGYFLASIGLNVNMELSTLKTIDIPATSLLEEGKRTYDVTSLISLLNKTFSNNLSIFKEKGFPYFYPLIRKRLAFVGEKASIEGRRGTIKGISLEGYLLLQTPAGEEKIISGHLVIDSLDQE